jgi:hypothetical protein
MTGDLLVALNNDFVVGMGFQDVAKMIAQVQLPVQLRLLRPQRAEETRHQVRQHNPMPTSQLYLKDKLQGYYCLCQYSRSMQCVVVLHQRPFGFMCSQLVQQYGVRGVVVDIVEGHAHVQGMQPGDIITQVGQVKLSDLSGEEVSHAHDVFARPVKS